MSALKLCAICPACGVTVSVTRRRTIARHPHEGATGSPRCTASGSTPPPVAVMGWARRALKDHLDEAARWSDRAAAQRAVAARTEALAAQERAEADRLRRLIDRLDGEVTP